MSINTSGVGRGRREIFNWLTAPRVHCRSNQGYENGCSTHVAVCVGAGHFWGHLITRPAVFGFGSWACLRGVCGMNLGKETSPDDYGVRQLVTWSESGHRGSRYDFGEGDFA